MSDQETRVVLVKPGDVLLIGNVGELLPDQQVTDALRGLKRAIGCEVYLFAEDIDIAALDPHYEATGADLRAQQASGEGTGADGGAKA